MNKKTNYNIMFVVSLRLLAFEGSNSSSVANGSSDVTNESMDTSVSVDKITSEIIEKRYSGIGGYNMLPQ